MQKFAFQKWHGLGNDFVIVDNRHGALAFSYEARRLIADRRIGAGCDQLIVLEDPQDPHADVGIKIYNPDGSEAGACGNGTRCVAALLFAENGTTHAVVKTAAGLLNCQKKGALVSVDMGKARLGWQDIPLAEEADPADLSGHLASLLPQKGVRSVSAVSMGNPHCIVFIDTLRDVPLETLGPKIENHKLFRDRTNVEFVQVLSPTHLHMRVWERGAGVTRACASGACAVAVAAVRAGLAQRKMRITLDGGNLDVEWREDDNHVTMSGPASHVFDGAFVDGALESA